MKFGFALNLFIAVIFVLLYHLPKIRDIRERNLAKHKRHEDELAGTNNQMGEGK